MPFLVFYVTYPNEATAQQIAGQLVNRRLAACANIFPIQSTYRWEAALQNEDEWVSILKTRTTLESALEQAILELHPYETPCILRYEGRANAAYEQWVEQETSET